MKVTLITLNDLYKITNSYYGGSKGDTIFCSNMITVEAYRVTFHRPVIVKEPVHWIYGISTLFFDHTTHAIQVHRYDK